jgi:cellulose synthase/poly-beta-1,6-N-acetylglucosamine synthase-like glycosyltransferase
MAFSAELLRTHPPNAYSIVEDLEYGIQLGLAGVRVEYAHDAHVFGQMAIGEDASRSQRRRWERGRQALVREHSRTLLSEAWRRKDAVLADLAFDLIVPPLGQLVAAALLGLTASLIAVRFGVVVAPWLWALSLLAVVGYVARGVAFSGMGLAGVLDLLWVPVYIMWKLTLRFGDRGQKPTEWVRTTREARS